VIVFPAVEMVHTSLQSMDIAGVSHGYVGLDNYRRLFAEPALGRVVTNTLVWVAVVVGVTVVVSLGLAQFLNKPFAGRRLVRWALIVPWAASLVMTATVWRYILEGSYGVLNRVLDDVGLISEPIDWYKEEGLAFWCLVAIGIIVSIPFTTYVVLAGLQAMPEDVYEAARIDGAGRWRIYFSITLPLLRPALLVAVVLNVIYVFNSFPLIWTITGNVPGNDTDTTITFAYRIAFKVQFDTGEAAALSVLNVALLLVIVLAYLRLVRWNESVPGARRSGPLTRAAAAAGRALLPVRKPLRRLLVSAGRHLLAWTGQPSGRSRPLGPSRTTTAVRRFGMPLAGAVLAAFFLAPYAVMFLASLKSDDDLVATPATYLPTQWMWSNWSDAWEAIPLLSYLQVSLTIAIASTVLVLLVAVPAAYYSARHNFRGRRAFLYLILVTQMFAPVALVVGIYREVILVGGVGAYWAIIVTDAAFNLAFAIWIMNAYFATIPVEIEEAAMLDGLGRLRTLLRVVLPMAKPGVVTAVVFTFIQVWNEFVIALTLFNDPLRNRQPLTVGVQQFIGLAQVDYQSLFVAALITIVPVVALFIAIERHLVAGLTAGSVK
jgi:multiple sugar transport system permease protein